ncbi:MAG: hypothetical protein CV087_10825 [Candidatus Brocadia sp. WS118]|nr:MAG: hypothetical protein CV087_10825 [Candidatus Brocadia sp. WS118]
MEPAPLTNMDVCAFVGKYEEYKKTGLQESLDEEDPISEFHFSSPEDTILRIDKETTCEYDASRVSFRFFPFFGKIPESTAEIPAFRFATAGMTRFAKGVR